MNYRSFECYQKISQKEYKLSLGQIGYILTNFLVEKNKCVEGLDKLVKAVKSEEELIDTAMNLASSVIFSLFTTHCSDEELKELMDEYPELKIIELNRPKKL